jgi:hypothetical protein
MADSASPSGDQYGVDSVSMLEENAVAHQLDECNDRYLHMYSLNDETIVCKTDTRGYPQPSSGSPIDLVLDANDGFIPLWDRNVTLRWRFQEQSMAVFVDQEAAKRYLRELIGAALLLWTEPALPVRFKEATDAWDFEVVVNATTDCDFRGCTLASAFFPDGGRHELRVFPTMFEQPRIEQVETMAHEIGHVFGLRHFFAQISETQWPSEIFGSHRNFSIMNYGADSMMTDEDRSDLRNLYESAWRGALTNINGTPIRLVRPFSDGRVIPTRDPACDPMV